MNNIILAFITGLTSGGISCLAVQGGLLATAVSNKSEDKQNNWKSVLLFLFTKLIAYSLLGAFLGIIGSVFILSAKLQAIIQILIGIFLVITALRLLDVHPIFRYFVIQPPKFAYRFLKERSISKSYFAPGLLGAFTVLIPCGITQSMMLLAISSKSAVYGSLILFAFVLGTSPVFFALGIGVLELLKKKAFVIISSIIIFVMAFFSVKSGLTLASSYIPSVPSNNSAGKNIKGMALQKDGKQFVEINVLNSAYNTPTKTLKLGVPVNLKLITNNTYGCSRAFTIPSLGIRTVLQTTGTETLEFTPKNLGKLVYTCSMGMYSGYFEVIN